MPLDQDDMRVESTGYDALGVPIYDEDLLDLRWADHLTRAGQPLDLERGLHALVFQDDVDMIRQGVEIFALMAEREIRRKGHPALLDEESGQAYHRAMVVADLRAAPRYAEVARKAGWPADPTT